MSFTSLLSQTCTVLSRATSTADGYGQPTYHWDESSTSFPCRVQARGRNSRFIVGDNLQSIASTHVMYAESSCPVSARKRVKVSGDTYTVLFVDAVRGASAVHHVECDLVLVVP